MGEVVAMTGWQEQAACRGAPITLFFGPEDETPLELEAREALARQLYCSRCEVRAACLAAAEATETCYAFGVWGDEGERDRRRRRRRLQRAAARERQREGAA